MLSSEKIKLVIEDISRGLSIKAIATNLKLSIGTVRKYSKLASTKPTKYTVDTIPKIIAKTIVPTTKTVDTSYLCKANTEECLVCRFKKYCIDIGYKVYLRGVLVSITDKDKVVETKNRLYKKH